MSEILWLIIAASLLFACYTDYCTCEVYNVAWWISGTAAILLMLLNGNLTIAVILELGVFCLIQLLLFAKMYGKADCYAFCVCAMAETACGMGFSEYLFHMMFAFGILAIIQLFSRNVNSKGNLKHPVPFLPYITAGFILVLLFF